MEPSTHHATWRAVSPVWTCSLSGLVFGTTALTAHEASSAFLTAGRLHPTVLGAAGVLGTAGLGAALLCAATGLAALTASAGLAAGSRSTAPGPAAALAAVGAGLLAGAGLQAALTGGTSGRLATAAALLALGYVATASTSSRTDGAAAECVKYVDARQVTVALAVEFTGRFAAVLLGMAQGAHVEKWSWKAWSTGLRMMLVVLWFFFVSLRASTARSLWMTLGHMPYYAAVNFLSWASPACAVLAAFLAGMGGVSEASPESEAELVMMLGSSLRLGALSAGLMGAALGAVAVVGAGREAAGRVAAGAAVTSLAALRTVVPAWRALGAGAGCLLGASVAAGVLLVMASRSSPHACFTLACSSFGAVLGSGGFESGRTLTALLAAGTAMFPYWEVAVTLPTDLLLLDFYRDTSADGAALAALVLGVAAAGAAALGGAALATAAMGTLGTLGVLSSALVSLGVTLAEVLKTLQGEPIEIMGSLMVLLALLSGTEMTYFIQFRP